MKIAALLLVCSLLPAQTGDESSSAKVATHYFYWYRWPKEHFQAGREGVEGHYHHFLEPEKVSYTDPDWHEVQFAAMAACGIDFALPVYWGVPGAYERVAIRFSRAGQAPMVEALTRLEKRDVASIRLGLFYDTTSLLCDVRGVKPRGGKPDLRKAPGRTLFCQTVVEYFERIPKRFWARIRGRVLVVLYVSAFASAFDESLGPSLRQAFARRFPQEKIYLVADRSWGEIGQDRHTSWGAALHGPRIFRGVAQIGPGYDDSPVPGRTTPYRDREEGTFYRWSWQQAIASRPELVLLETWNEMHEGTEICETAETGRSYLVLTRDYIQRLQRGDPGPKLELRFALPRHRPDLSWGSEAKQVSSVYADYTKDVPERLGLRELPREDGPIRVHNHSLRPYRAAVGQTFVYFKISDFFRFEVDEDLEVILDLEPSLRRDIAIDYDSHDTHDSRATVQGSYTRVEGRVVQSDRKVQRLLFYLRRARLANRQNGGADFRLRIKEARTVIRRVRVRVPPRDRR